MSDTISVVIPTFRHAELVCETLTSVQAQTRLPKEIIVINDGSPDDTATRLRPWVDKGMITYVEQENQGQAVARNRGLAIADAEFIAFLDDDDLWPRDKLEWQSQFLKEHPECPAVGGLAEYVDVDGRAGQIQPSALGSIGRRELFRGNPFTSPGQVLIRKSALVAIGGFDVTVWGADDYDLWFRLTSIGPIASLDKVALHYRLHDKNASKNHLRMLTQTRRVINNYLDEEPAPGRRVASRDAERFLYRYFAGSAIARTRRSLRQVELRNAVSNFLLLRFFLTTFFKDPVVFRWFIRAWMPRGRRD